MSACQCCGPIETPKITEAVARNRHGKLFNWLTALLITLWMGIVAVAAELAGPDQLAPVSTLEAFIQKLL